jgi:protein-S-isoprenylcysteine O-methyltransferase Ste14
MVASFQLLLVFLLWSPEGRVLWVPTGIVYYVHCALYALSWLLLGKAMWDGHLGIQTGYIGWTSIWKGHRSIRWPKMPTEGLFRVCRQPIYFSFMLTLWTGPVWTIDKLCVALVWTAYCYFGPTYKEKRMSKRFGEEFAAYKERVPYWPF